MTIIVMVSGRMGVTFGLYDTTGKVTEYYREVTKWERRGYKRLQNRGYWLIFLVDNVIILQFQRKSSQNRLVVNERHGSYRDIC